MVFNSFIKNKFILIVLMQYTFFQIKKNVHFIQNNFTEQI